MDIIGTVDVLVNRFSKLRIRYSNWISNPQVWDSVHEDCERYYTHLKNVQRKVESCESLSPEKRSELDDYITSVNRSFEKVTRDLERLEEHLSQTKVAQDAQDVQNANHKNKLTTNIYSSSSTDQQPVVVESSNNRFKIGTEILKKGVKGITRATRTTKDTEILDSISRHVGDAKHTLLCISNFIYHHKQMSMVLSNHNASTFHKHFVKPFRSVNWVTEFNQNYTHNSLDASNLPGNTNLYSCSTNLTHEQKLKQKLMAFHSFHPPISSTNNQAHQRNFKHIPSLCVHGQGGMGKSVTLQSVCYDEDVQAKFADGIHFLLFGENASKQDAIKEIVNCVRNAGYENLATKLSSNDNIHEVAKDCSKVFEGKRVLFVADDLWITEWSGSGFFEQIVTLASGTSGGGILFSTRDRALMSEASDDVEFGMLDVKGEESKSILKAYIKQGYDREEGDLFMDMDERGQSALEEVLELCGGWKLCLGIAGGALCEDIRDCGNDVNEGIRMYVEMLREDQKMLIREKTATYNNLITVAESSIRRCRDWGNKKGIQKMRDGELSIEEMFWSLGVMEQQKWVPVCVVYGMWGVGRRYGEMVVKQFSRVNLVSRRSGNKEIAGNGDEKQNNDRKDHWGWVIRVHDRMIDVCNDMCEEKEGGGSKWHNRLLDSCIERRKKVRDGKSNKGSLGGNRCREWWDGKKVSGSYMMRNLSRHLVSGGHWEELYELVTDVRWTLRRRRDGGWIGLEEDMRALMAEINKSIKKNKKANGESEDRRKSESNNEEKKGLEMLFEGLEELKSIVMDSWIGISDGEHQIGFEVYEKVCDDELKHEAIQKYLRSIDLDGPRPWLLPVTKWRRKVDGRERARIAIPGVNHKAMCLSSDSRYFAGIGKQEQNKERVIIMERHKRKHGLMWKPVNRRNTKMSTIKLNV